ncbi:MAG: cytochrome c biogenesis protein CcsA [Planctomycetes bacterium]|nr:cytochrome c biogenesis protein CcsA [Planctomycetota bacterium]
MKNLLRIATLFLVALASTLSIAAAQSAAQAAAARPGPWPKEVVEIAQHLPVQDGGRVKPLNTYAGYLLLRLNGKRSVTTPEGEKLEAMPWLLDVLFYPELAETYDAFMVQDGQAIEAIGVSVEGKKKRDRYSFRELRPGIQRLFQLANEYQAIEEKDRNTVQQQVFMLAMNVNDFMRILTHLDLARARLPVGAGDGLAQMFSGAEEVTFSQVLDHVPELRDLQLKLSREPATAAESKTIGTLLHTAADLTSGTESLALLPATGSLEAEPAWHTPADLLTVALRDSVVEPKHVEMLASLEGMARARADFAGFQREITRFQGLVVPLAEKRGEYEKVGLEVTYHELGLLGNAQVVFVLAFVLAAGLWLKPKSKLLYGLTTLAVIVPTILVTIAIVLRCMIRERPPVSTLYETLLFVTATGAITALVAELVTKQKVALSAAAVLGMIGLFVANGYEMLDKRDTMPQLVAVLDTNFWLATHVTAITIGYSAGMLAALLASLYLITKVVGFKRSEPAFHHGLGRMVYGVLCFGLIFSTVGTILGGIWANESWGRFWGWDPKENGALLICLSQLVILHCRMGGILREHGVCMATAFGGTVIAFSWFGVNLLGVGLHSYGFTSGIHTALWSYYWIQWGIVGLGGLHWYLERVRSNARREAMSNSGSRLSPAQEPMS